MSRREMSGGRRKKTLKIFSRIDASMLEGDSLAVQMTSSTLADMLDDAARADEALLYVDDRDLARILFEKIGNAHVAEEAPGIGEEVFYMVALRKAGEGAEKAPTGVEGVTVYRCVLARGAWL